MRLHVHRDAPPRLCREDDCSVALAGAARARFVRALAIWTTLGAVGFSALAYLLEPSRSLALGLTGLAWIGALGFYDCAAGASE